MYACVCTHPGIVGGKAPDCTSELLCVDGYGLYICGSPGRAVPVSTRAPSFFPSCLCGSQEAVCSATTLVVLWNILLHTVHLDCLSDPVEGSWLPGMSLDLGLSVDSGPRRSRQ